MRSFNTAVLSKFITCFRRLPWSFFSLRRYLLSTSWNVDQTVRSLTFIFISNWDCFISFQISGQANIFSVSFLSPDPGNVSSRHLSIRSTSGRVCRNYLSIPSLMWNEGRNKFYWVYNIFLLNDLNFQLIQLSRTRKRK